MSYAQKKELSGNRTLSIIMVGAASVRSGLCDHHRPCLQRDQEGGRGSQDVRRRGTAAAPEEPPPPPKDMPKVPPPPMTPPPLVRMNRRRRRRSTVVERRRPPPIPPVVQRRRRRRRRRRRARCSRRRAPRATCAACSAPTIIRLRRSLPAPKGTVQASLTIGPDGRVVGCNVTRSSGNSSLDGATCNILRRRAKFTPARDSNGKPTTDTHHDPADRVAVGRLITPRFSNRFSEGKTQLCKQHPPQQV